MHVSFLRNAKLYRLLINLAIAGCLIVIIIYNFISLIYLSQKLIHDPIITNTHLTVIITCLIFYGISVVPVFLLFSNKNNFINSFSFSILRFYLILFFCFTILFYFCVTPLKLPLRIENHFGFASFLIFSIFSGYYILKHPSTKLNKIKAFSASEYLLFQIAFCAILLELGLAIWVRFTDSPLAVYSKNARGKIQLYRAKPGNMFWGVPFNSLGFYDKEFCTTGEAGFVVNAFSDSFGVGIVPLSHNFLKIAERRLQDTFSNKGICINNFSVEATGVPEYLELYKNEARGFPCDVTMVCIFVGNDIEDVEKTNNINNVWNFSRWHLPNIIHNIYVLNVSSKKEKNLLSIGRTDPSQSNNGTGPIYDATDETPHMSESAFLNCERGRFEQICVNNSVVEENYRYILPWLKLFKKHIREKYLLVIIPDEFQVNDSLYLKITEHMDLSKIERDKPQRVIAAFCKQEQIEYLDLLPILREAETTGHCYHPRDTHWNQKGNYIAGEKIAQVLIERIKKIKGW